MLESAIDLIQRPVQTKASQNYFLNDNIYNDCLTTEACSTLPLSQLPSSRSKNIGSLPRKAEGSSEASRRFKAFFKPCKKLSNEVAIDFESSEDKTAQTLFGSSGSSGNELPTNKLN